MPYTRVVRLDTPLLSWHELTLLEATNGWSDPYRAASPRLLLPQTRWIECEQRGQRFVGDSISPLWLTPEHAYRMRQPWRGQRSWIVILHTAQPAATLRRRVLPAAAQWQLMQSRQALRLGRANALAVEEQLVGLLNELSGDDAPAPTARCQRAVETAREFIASRLDGDDSLAQIAAAAHYSPFHLARQFKRCTGLGLHAYRTRLRLATALQRLSDGDETLATLAVDLGFSSHSHFTAAFRSAYGIAPRAMRRNLTAHAAH